MDKKRIQELAAQLPSSWNELKIKDYYKLMKMQLADESSSSVLLTGMENTYNAVTTLTDATEEELDAMLKLDVEVAAKVFNKLLFLYNGSMDADRKPSIKIKKRVDYATYITCMVYQQNPIENLHLFIRSIAVDDLTDDEAKELSVEEGMCCFFLFVKNAKKYSKLLKLRLWMKVITQMPKAMMKS